MHSDHAAIQPLNMINVNLKVTITSTGRKESNEPYRQQRLGFVDLFKVVGIPAAGASESYKEPGFGKEV